MAHQRLACAAVLASLWWTGTTPVRAQSASLATPAADTLPGQIPIFPLEVAMLFPGVSRPLYIFEPRYRAMVADALKGDRIIGMSFSERPAGDSTWLIRPPILIFSACACDSTT